MTRSLIRTALFSLGVSLLTGLAVVGQPAPTPQPKPNVPKVPTAPNVWKWETPSAMPRSRGTDNTERSIAADKNVNLTLCLNQADLKINGWNRNEVRVFVRNGSSFLFKVQLKGQSGLPALMTLYAYNSKPGKYMGDCISAEEIEIDAPIGATINIKGREARTAIDSIRKVNVQTIGGDIMLRNIGESISASTGQGGITVEQSKGPMILNTTTGNVVVFDVGPYDIGDVLKAKTNSGNLSLQDIGYRQVEVNSISGSILYSGQIINGASYGLGTSNGSIRMQLPDRSSFQLSAIFASGNFSSEGFTYKILSEDIREGSIKNVVAKFGTGGDAVVKLTTNAGLIGIRKQ